MYQDFVAVVEFCGISRAAFMQVVIPVPGPNGIPIRSVSLRSILGKEEKNHNNHLWTAHGDGLVTGCKTSIRLMGSIKLSTPLVDESSFIIVTVTVTSRPNKAGEVRN